MRWGRIEHPEWCGQAHHCTAEGGGEHASAPNVWKTDAGKLVATRHQPVKGEAYATLRLVVALPADDTQARQLGGQLVTAALHTAGLVLDQRTSG
jgi:hypothetical protein